MSGNYDVQQVCENGHQINDSCKQYPEHCQKFCDKCGAQTITTCLHCNTEIRGYFIVPGVYGGGADVPSHCHNCGKPYPWTKNKIMTAIQIFAEFGNLDDEEKKNIEKDINNIAKDIPQSELSAMRIKRIWEKYGRIAYNVIMEFTSKTASEILKNP
ncbi:unnamed protein product [marine sediment metagenome]|uniref:DUF2321 domain-containing protein n=1 Tax=marine sediment metagenome TaxID=412755 RepID=X1EMR0_9ZZZZ